MKIKSDNMGIIHYVAYCSKCSWQACVFTDETPTTEKVINATKKHVRDTGHEVVIEGGTARRYFAEHAENSDE